MLPDADHAFGSNFSGLAKFDRFEDLEDQVMDYLASVTDLKVFGCCHGLCHRETTQAFARTYSLMQVVQCLALHGSSLT